jgi:hypothetical protein
MVNTMLELFIAFIAFSVIFIISCSLFYLLMGLTWRVFEWLESLFNFFGSEY